MSLMIMPLTPHLPSIYEINRTNRLEFIVGSAIILILAIFAALLVGKCAASRFDGSKKKTEIGFVGITALMAALLLCFFGYGLTAIKGIIISLILVYTSYEDIKKRECDDYLHLMIVIAAFIGIDFAVLPNMFISAMFAGGLMLLTVLITNADIGGADIKMAAACCFLLGLTRGVIGLLAGMILAVIFNVFRKDKKKGFPMIPYLAAGTMAAFFIQV